MATRRAVFVDRDGTLIEDAEYLAAPDGVQLIPGAADAIAELRRRGFAIVLVSNQSGIGRGFITPEQADAVHERFVAELARRGAVLDAVLYCPHTPDDGCECRKPLPGLLNQAAAELGVDLGSSFMIGDRASDVEAGRAAGCRTILFGDPGGAPAPADFAAPDWQTVRAIVDGARPGR